MSLRTKLILGGLAAAAIALGAQAAAPAAGPSKDPKTVQAGKYVLEPLHAQILFSVSHMGLSTWYGDFHNASGTLQIDPAKPAAAMVEINIPTNSVNTINDTLNTELKSPAWLDPAKYPTITFKSTKVTPTGAGKADVTGNLTFHGVTKPMTLKVSFLAAGTNAMNKKFTAGFEASGSFKRSDFGVKTYLPMIGDDINLMISAPFERN
ncbi:MAG: YceI family protein [Caulobacteraceae bacterium]